MYTFYKIKYGHNYQYSMYSIHHGKHSTSIVDSNEVVLYEVVLEDGVLDGGEHEADVLCV